MTFGDLQFSLFFVAIANFPFVFSYRVAEEELPAGVYFYIIEIESKKGIFTIEKTGYLYILK